jgi:hypothetical protein
MDVMHGDYFTSSAARNDPLMIRTRICLYILLLTPLAVYWQTIFHDYGQRNDYTYLRVAREEPGRLVKLTASHGRPLNGALLETSFGVTSDVSQLPWLRLASVLMLTLLALGRVAATLPVGLDGDRIRRDRSGYRPAARRPGHRRLGQRVAAGPGPAAGGGGILRDRD